MPKSKLTIAEQIAKAKEDIKQEENKLKLLNAKQKEQERRDRTKRLIERGAILESLIDGAENLDNERIKTILQTALSSRHITPRAATDTGETATAARTE
jgi:Skp family chaperone for outer membrane proteins